MIISTRTRYCKHADAMLFLTQENEKLVDVNKTMSCIYYCSCWSRAAGSHIPWGRTMEHRDVRLMFELLNVCRRVYQQLFLLLLLLGDFE